MTAFNTYLLTRRQNLTDECRRIAAIRLVAVLSRPEELEKRLKKELSGTPDGSILLLIDQRLAEQYESSGLPSLIAAKTQATVMRARLPDDQPSSDGIGLEMTLPLGECAFADLMRAATAFHNQQRTIQILRQIVERPGDFYRSDLLRNDLDHHLFDAHYQAARRRFRLLAATVQQTREGILLITPEGVIEYVNHAGEQLLGYSRRHLVGRHITRLRAEELSNTLLHTLKKLAVTHTSWQGSISLDEVVFDLSVTSIRDKEEQIAGYAVIISDITEKEMMERRFMEVEKLEALGTLAGGIAHDFNNILLALQANVEAIMMLNEPPPQIKKYYDRIFKACDRAGMLIRHFLNFSRCVKEPETTVSLRDIIGEVVSLLEPIIPRHIDLHTRISDIDEKITANPVKIYEVILNLVKNALDAMGERRGTVTIGVGSEKLPAANHYGMPGGEYFRLEIIDTGDGMPQDIANRIFEPFFTTKKIGHGSGLGLSIVYSIVQSMNGHIGVKSMPGKGSEFYVLLPSSSQAREKTPHHLDEHILMVCRDSGVYREQLAATLAATGCRVTTAADADKMVEMFADSPLRYDMIVSEKVYRTGQSENLFEKIFQIRSNVPAIFITDYSETIDLSYAVLDRLVMLMRPYDTNVLQQAVRTLFARRPLLPSRRES